jgi:hypothetical protein
VVNTFAHEFGHHVDQFITKLSYQNRDRIFDEIEDAVRAEAKRKSYNVEAEMPGRMSGMTLDNYVQTNKRAFTRWISEYGSTNSAELFAEIWSEYTGVQPRPHIKRIGDLILKATQGEDIHRIPRNR